MIVIDPGHGGVDPGASGNGIIEKDYNLMISKYMYDRFRQLGIPVAITRQTDITLTPDQRVKLIMDSFGNNSNVVLISNHLNAGGGTGAEVIYALRDKDTLSRLILENIEATGQVGRKYYQRRLPSDTSKDYNFLMRDTGLIEPVIVEYGFMDSTATEANFLRNNYKVLAEAVIKAVTTYKRLPYTAPGGLVSNTYTVKSGDNLYDIAAKYNTTVDELKRLNNLTSNLLNVGQILKIPTTTSVPTGNTYTVKSGDSLYSIAKKFNTTATELKTLNNLTSNLLSIGQILKVPGTAEEPIPSTGTTYTVKSGDSLYSIGLQFGTTGEAIKSYNNLTSNLLSIGQTLKIPGATSGTNTYTVKSGDNLYDIATRFNTTVNELKRLNNLTSNLLDIGQVLIIK